MSVPFFPNLAFAWTYLAVLLAILAAASYIDARFMRVPKVLTLSAAGLGLLFNLVRGAWTGGRGQEVWCLGANGPVVGLVDGVLFALAGAALGFVLFLIMWLLGACGGGDVKLFAAVGAWVGPLLAIYVLLVTLPVIIGFIVVRFFVALVSGDGRTLRRIVRPGAERKAAPGAGRRLLAFSLPVTLATGLVLFWSHRADLKLADAPPARVQAQGGSHAN